MKTVNQIEKGNYEGYLWYSDKQEPEVLMHTTLEMNLDSMANPFIVEAQLYNKEARISYSIKYVDGKYLAYRYDDVAPEAPWATAEQVIESQTYCSNRMGNLELVFLQSWRTQPDALCEGMQVLQPAEQVFVGFKEEGGK